MVFVTGQREMPGDALRDDKLLEQRRRKLNILSGGATNHHLPGRPAIIIQILIRRDAELKFVTVHGISVLPAKPEPAREGKRYPGCSMRNIGRLPPTLFLIGSKGPVMFMPESLADEGEKDDLATTARLTQVRGGGVRRSRRPRL